MVNRMQTLVLGFFVAVWASVLVILVAALQLTGVLASDVPAWPRRCLGGMSP